MVRRTFSYIFESPPGSGYPPLLDQAEIEPGRCLSLEGPGGAIAALPFRVHHGEIDALGFRFGAIAYSPDLNAIPDASLGALEDLDLWIVDALRYTRHPSHFSLDETLGWIAKHAARSRAVLTNLHTDMDYATLAAELPPGIEPAVRRHGPRRLTGSTPDGQDRAKAATHDYPSRPSSGLRSIILIMRIIELDGRQRLARRIRRLVRTQRRFGTPAK